MKFTFNQVCAASILAFCSVSSVSAQTASNYPDKPIKLIAGFPPGGISDVLARGLAAKLSTQLGQPVIVENKPGAGTTIAANSVAKSAPDGYTLMLQDMTTHAINAAAYKTLPYDSLKDFSLITLVASTPLMLVVNPSHKVSDIKGLVALAKSKPGELAYSSSGNGAIAHLAGEAFKTTAGFNTLHAPYKGSAPATQAVVGGEVAYTFSTMPPALAQVKGGKLVALAVTTPKRVNAAPDVPTMKESGVPIELVIYTGILGPKGLPPAIQNRINSEFAKAVASPEVKQVYATIGADPITTTPDEFMSIMRTETDKMAKAVNAAGVKFD
jgi:tripartite-type tricarboxylate transporter receptor subunit TctC